MVKKITLLIMIIMITIYPSNAYALRDDYKSDGNYIEDYANIFDDNLEKEKNNNFISLLNEYNVPVYLYTIAESHSYSSRDLADELLYQRVGLDKDGILLLIDMYNSEIYITASGDYAIKIMDDDRKEELLDVIAPLIRTDSNSVMDKYYSTINRYFTEGVKSGLIIQQEKSIELKDIIIAAVASVVGFFGSQPVFKSSAISNPGKKVFSLMDSSNMNNLLIKDAFFNSRTTRNRIMRSVSSGSSGGRRPTSTTHKSSRGGTYTGSGRKF